MRPVVSCLAWGLGNQLFQFTAGYALARKLDVPLDLDISWYQRSRNNWRDLLVTEIFPRSWYRHLTGYTKKDYYIDRLLRYANFSKPFQYRHRMIKWHRNLDDSWPFERILKPVCLSGIPQNFRYLHGFEQEIREQIISFLRQKAPNTSLGENYAFVHVRLGDFVSNPKVSAEWHNLTQDYFQSAMSRYEDISGPTNWIVCSDEPERALAYVPKNYQVELSPGKSELEDLYLMANSAGGVISNSTFSAWGAFLAQQHNETIIAPQKWWRDKPAPPLPSSWHRI